MRARQWRRACLRRWAPESRLTPYKGRAGRPGAGCLGGERQLVRGLDLASDARHGRVQHSRAEQALSGAGEDSAEEAAPAAHGDPRPQLNMRIQRLDVVFDVDLDRASSGEQEALLVRADDLDVERDLTAGEPAGHAGTAPGGQPFAVDVLDLEINGG